MSNLVLNESEFILYTTPQGGVRLDVLVSDESIWLTQKSMAELFGVVKSTISEYLSNIYGLNELSKEATVRDFRTVQTEGNREVSRYLEFYNLNSIISVGYRVNSLQATQFRIWATKTLKEYIIKGFVMDDERLKKGDTLFGKDYLKELLERVRSIRESERRVYQQITDIFAECSIDYDPKSDAGIVKNYLKEKEIKQLERTVSGYFDYIEDLIERRNTFTMDSLSESVNKFLTFNEYEILEGKGKTSHQKAIDKADHEYDVFNKTQKIDSDFDKHIKRIQSKNKH